MPICQGELHGALKSGKAYEIVTRMMFDADKSAAAKLRTMRTMIKTLNKSLAQTDCENPDQAPVCVKETAGSRRTSFSIEPEEDAAKRWVGPFLHLHHVL